MQKCKANMSIRILRLQADHPLVIRSSLFVLTQAAIDIAADVERLGFVGRQLIDQRVELREGLLRLPLPEQDLGSRPLDLGVIRIAVESSFQRFERSGEVAPAHEDRSAMAVRFRVFGIQLGD